MDNTKLLSVLANYVALHYGSSEAEAVASIFKEVRWTTDEDRLIRLATRARLSTDSDTLMYDLDDILKEVLDQQPEPKVEKPRLSERERIKAAAAAYAIGNHFSWAEAERPPVGTWNEVFQALLALAGGVDGALSTNPTFIQFSREYPKASQRLMAAFVWSDTPQGHDYWNGIHQALITIESTDSYDTENRLWGDLY